jgi:hypothetical protein
MSVSRRRFVLSSAGWVLGSGAITAGLLGCDGSVGPVDAAGIDATGADATSTDMPDAGPLAWAIGTIELVRGERDDIALLPLLPAEAAPGGTFSVASDGAALPAGMILGADGVLQIGSALAGTTEGVVFLYQEP